MCDGTSKKNFNLKLKRNKNKLARGLTKRRFQRGNARLESRKNLLMLLFSSLILKLQGNGVL